LVLVESDQLWRVMLWLPEEKSFLLVVMQQAFKNVASELNCEWETLEATDAASFDACGDKGGREFGRTERVSLIASDQFF
jgi:hypothetical protein